MTIPAAQYVRMSSDKQPLSISVQKAQIAAYASTNDLEVLRTYSDEAKSGVTLKRRSGMQQLLRDVLDDACPFEVVLVLDVARWGRFQDADEAGYHEYHCRKNGVRVVYVSEQFGGSDSPADTIFKQVKRMMAAEYSRDLAVKCRTGQVNSATLGYAAGLLPPIGYRREAVSCLGVSKGLLVPGQRKPSVTDRVRWVLGPEAEQEQVRTIFREYAEGATPSTIARRLNHQQVRTHNGAQFNAEMIRRLLRSEIVRGIYAWGRRGARRNAVTGIAPLPASIMNLNMVEAVVEEDVWNAVQARLRETAMIWAGIPREVLRERLRDVLARNPGLRGEQFHAEGLACSSLYRKHFGCLRIAYREARRDDKASALDHSRVASAGHQTWWRFFEDIKEALRALGFTPRVLGRQHVILINGVRLKIHTSRLLVSAGDARWNLGNASCHRARGGWLLVMLLNSDSTGRQFLLIPPWAIETFSGKVNSAVLREMDDYCISDQHSLFERLANVFAPRLTTATATSFRARLTFSPGMSDSAIPPWPLTIRQSRRRDTRTYSE